MRSRLFRPLSRLALGAGFVSLLGLGGCQSLVERRYADSLPPEQGIVRLQGLADNVAVRRNAQGMPLIETRNYHDAMFALGYVHASDRLSQMLGMRLLAGGRLAEMHGPGVLEIDRFMRALSLKRSAEALLKSASPQTRQVFEVYARGVNAYLYQHRGKLPADIAATGYRPEYWTAQDSALLFCLVNFSLSTNLQEELAALSLAQKVGADKLAWLTPSYPDEPLPFEEAKKLAGLDLSGRVPGLAELSRTGTRIAGLLPLGVAASNNWAIAPQKSRHGKSLLANDTHLPLTLPSLWSFVQIRSPKFQAAGVSVAGLPAVAAGFNGKLAWSMTMVMADTQDLFLEQLKQEGGRLYYRAGDRWQPLRERQETFLVKGEKPRRETFYETAHGPLLNDALGERRHELQLSSRYGLALQSIPFDGDNSLDAFFRLSQAGSVDQAFVTAGELRAMALNLVFADAGHIGWQVTGRYPNRRAGVGLLPSPGWDGRYDWDGFADPMLHPYDQDPMQGWLGTANQRPVPRGYGMQLSNSWYSPGRAERIAELAGRGRHDTQSMIAMQYDQTSTFAARLKAMLEAPGMAGALRQAIDALPPAKAGQAREALTRLLAFDGRLAADSTDAALYGAFLRESARQIFLDELGPDDGAAWQALLQMSDLSYSAQADHLLGREDSPFWDDVGTPQKEDKPAILARSLAAATAYLEQRLGSQRNTWQWGKLHPYRWISDGTRLAPYLSVGQRGELHALGGLLDRGPVPAGGDQDTLNAAAYRWGQDFDVWLAPSMRLVVDFAREEPMLGQIGTGQSGNPASPHYADGIDAWLKGQYASFPFKAENLDKAYGTRRLLLVPTGR